MARNGIDIEEKNEKEWEAENDAYVLIESEKLKLDPKRLAAAQKKAADIIKKQVEESRKNLQIAKKFNNNKKSKGKK